jgi:hypothetical protein
MSWWISYGPLEIEICQCLMWVNRVGLTLYQPLPVHPEQRTFSAPVGMSGWCHSRTMRRRKV